jgi:hypothetical protein
MAELHSGPCCLWTCLPPCLGLGHDVGMGAATMAQWRPPDLCGLRGSCLWEEEGGGGVEWALDLGLHGLGLLGRCSSPGANERHPAVGRFAV